MRSGCQGHTSLNIPFVWFWQVRTKLMFHIIRSVRTEGELQWDTETEEPISVLHINNIAAQRGVGKERTATTFFLSSLCLVRSGCYNKEPPTWASWTIDIYFSQFWRLDVWDRNVGRMGSWRGPSSAFQTAAFLLCVHVAENTRHVLCSLFL